MQNNNQTDTSALLAQILLKPSNQIIEDRFSATEAAPCGPTCTGQCHGMM